MATLAARIDRVVQELSSIQADLNRVLVEDATGEGPTDDLVAATDLEGLRDLKSVVDQVRHFLWFYLQVVAGGSEASERTMQLLRQASKGATAMNATSPLTFFERLNALTEYALVHYQDDETRKPN